jgi:hypothetical protein
MGLDMFSKYYFAPRFFPGRYFAKIGLTAIKIPIELTLRPRGFELTLNKRGFELTLNTRGFELTLKDGKR